MEMTELHGRAFFFQIDIVIDRLALAIHIPVGSQSTDQQTRKNWVGFIVISALLFYCYVCRKNALLF